MPELPEVEIVTRRLRTLIAGETIGDARLYRAGLSPVNTPRQFRLRLKGARVREIARRGKHILAHLSNDQTLVTHLRMTGRFLYLNADAEHTRHTHAALWFESGRKLLFDDQRHFGLMMVVPTDTLSTIPAIAKLAPEPFDPAFTPESLHAVLRRSAQPIKLALLDQTKVLGLGNIYAAEALHRAGIDPRLPANRLSAARAARLHGEILAVLGEAIENDAPFDAASGDLDSSYGRYDSLARVYERDGLPCHACGARVQRIAQGGRSTYFCPRCQRR